MVYIIKRNGSVVPFNQDKIITAINKALIVDRGTVRTHNKIVFCRHIPNLR